MIRYFEQFSLKNNNTFGVDVKTSQFFEFTEMEDLPYFFAGRPDICLDEIVILGTGSNILFTTDYKGIVIRPNIPGITEINEDRQNV